jgi:tRNA-Thr(GGU) m(6)t(6)A37 methyltransferase TsaA
MSMTYEPIGTIHTPHLTLEGIPIQSKGGEGSKGTITIDRKFAEGLEDLDGFSHIFLIYHFHQSKSYHLKPVPFLDNKAHGVFSTRAPRRPNPIGISVVRLTGIKDNVLEIQNVDILDGTPLLDIKPYVPEFDIFEVEKIGWIENKIGNIDKVKSDDRFK